MRFLFSRVVFIREIARRLMFNQLYIRPRDYLLKMSNRVLDTMQSCGIRISSSTVLEIGPGASLIMALGFAVRGAGKILLVDKYPRWNRTSPAEDADYIDTHAGNGAKQYIDSSGIPRPGVFRHVLNSAEDMRDVASSSIDIIISAGVLEHVARIGESFDEMRRVLRLHGVMYHYISLGDHYNFARPFKFLKYSDFTWNNFLTKEGYSYMNRLRVDDYERLARVNGFRVLHAEKVTCEGLDMKKINKKFRSKSVEDLKTVDYYVLLQKV